MLPENFKSLRRLQKISRQIANSRTDHAALQSATSSTATSTLNNVYIVAAARTPFGSFRGSLAHLSATDLGSIAIRAAVERANLPPESVDEVFMGNVCSAMLGQSPARQAALKAGIPSSVDCTTINKVCSSGMKAISLGAQSISLGHHDIVIAGGMESMSNIPHYANLRKGQKLGDAPLIDGLLHDGLSDAFHGVHMGECAEECAQAHGITRDIQDAHAINSVKRAKRALEDGVTAWEMVAIELPHGRGKQQSNATLTEDEALHKMDPVKLRSLPPYFKPTEGTITAGNASPITDGAAVVILASATAVRKHDLPVLGQVLSFADAAKEPKEYPTAPSDAILKALRHTRININDVDFWEINEAFSVVDLVNQKILGLDPDKVNVHGGAVALGHPLGASGARLIVTLLNVLRVKNESIGVAAICNGGGGSSAMVIQRTRSIMERE